MNLLFLPTSLLRDQASLRGGCVESSSAVSVFQWGESGRNLESFPSHGVKRVGLLNFLFAAGCEDDEFWETDSAHSRGGGRPGESRGNDPLALQRRPAAERWTPPAGRTDVSQVNAVSDGPEGCSISSCAAPAASWWRVLLKFFLQDIDVIISGLF